MYNMPTTQDLINLGINPWYKLDKIKDRINENLKKSLNESKQDICTAKRYTT
jgi:hypothetical protein